jgi:uncharacterized protein (DUF1697 family)
VPRYIAFLRAINVGGHVVPMEVLRRVFVAAGFSGVETFIASGNVVFTSPGADAAALERRIETALEKAFGYAVRTFVRTPAELEAIAGHQPCTADPAAAGGAIHIIFLAQALDAAARREVAALSAPGDEFSASGREVYWCRFGKLSESPLFGKSLGKTIASGTMRNRNTVVRLLARLQAAPAPPKATSRRPRKESS